jgi:hypothetical protein
MPPDTSTDAPSVLFKVQKAHLRNPYDGVIEPLSPTITFVPFPRKRCAMRFSFAVSMTRTRSGASTVDEVPCGPPTFIDVYRLMAHLQDLTNHAFHSILHEPVSTL